ncbi:MAG: hypothetical protein ACI4TX_03225, partial [Christensenellales bacterium]
EASLEDSLINLVIIKKVPKWKIPFMLLTFLRGNHLNKSWCYHIKCKKVEIENVDGEPLLINVDGQLLQKNKFIAEIVPCKLLCLNKAN